MRADRVQRLSETIFLFVVLWLIAMPINLLVHHASAGIAITAIAAFATLTAAIARS